MSLPLDKVKSRALRAGWRSGGALRFGDRKQPGRRGHVGLGRHERHLDLGGCLVRLEEGLDGPLKFGRKVFQGQCLGDRRFHVVKNGVSEPA